MRTYPWYLTLKVQHQAEGITYVPKLIVRRNSTIFISLELGAKNGRGRGKVDNIRIKDLASNLGVSAKEVIAALKNLGIAATSQTKQISQEEAQKVRETLRRSSDNQEGITAPSPNNVIVRRRKPTKDQERRQAGKRPLKVDKVPSPKPEEDQQLSGETSSVPEGKEMTASLDAPSADFTVQVDSESITLDVSSEKSGPAELLEEQVAASRIETDTSSSAPNKYQAKVISTPAKPETQKTEPTLQKDSVASEIAEQEDFGPQTGLDNLLEAKEAALSSPAGEAFLETSISEGAADSTISTSMDRSVGAAPEVSEDALQEMVSEKIADSIETDTSAAEVAEVNFNAEDNRPLPPEVKDSSLETSESSPAPEQKPKQKISSMKEVTAIEVPVTDESPKSEKRRKKTRREVPSGPQVKIISMPAPPPPAAPAAQDSSAEDSGGHRRSSSPAAENRTPTRPGGARQPYAPRPGASRPGANTGTMGNSFNPIPAAEPSSAEDARDKKKGRKDRRVVEFTPGTGQTQERRPPKGSSLKKGKGTVLQDKTGGRAQAHKKKRRDERPASTAAAVTAPLKAGKRKIRMDESIRVGDLAHQMGIKAQDLIKVLLGLGVMVTINQSLDLDTATLAASEFDYEVERVGFIEDDFLVQTQEDRPEDLKSRPPVVTIMGHVDHGKTSLLDAIRTTSVASGEAGGITQHIGAYHVATDRGEIVFLDTPGHEAFTAMRARGAQMTDIVVLVVAADDGVKDQTREAVNHAQAAGVPIVVAVNKIDKLEADPDRVKRELADLNLVPEEWGGDTIFSYVSAKQRVGLDDLLELILLQSDMVSINANPNKPARGHIVEARLDRGRGPVATVLVEEGTLRQGDDFVCGVHAGRVRAMFNDAGIKIREAGPSMPVEVQGFDGVPEAGDEFACVEDDRLARRIADARATKQREKELGKTAKVTLETFLAGKVEAESQQTLNLVIKADVQGSLEAISEALGKLSTDKVKVRVIHSAAGAITESDVLLASASQAIIIGFNVRPSVKVKEAAENEGVDIRFYEIIYKLVGDVRDAMSGLLAPVLRESYLGQAEVRDTFVVPRVGTVAGCAVLDGKLARHAGVRLLRDGVVIYTGKLSSLKRFKDDVKEVQKGYECGVGLENYNDIKVGDVIEAFETVEEKASLE